MIAAIMPCRGRVDQTVRNVKRLLSTAGDVEWSLFCVVDGDDTVMTALVQLIEAEHYAPGRLYWKWLSPDHGRRWGYWRALQSVTDAAPTTDAPLLVNLANDLLPGQHWLARAEAAYRATFGDGPGMVGFNDGHHETEHSCHFLISRSLLDRYGGWPVWYDHNYGDTELCQRAIADNVYVKAPYATLFHDHVYFGGTDDAVYAEGRARAEQDRLRYERRRMNGWQS